MKENITRITDYRRRKSKLNVFPNKGKEMRKFELSRIINIFFNFHNHFPTGKKVLSESESFLIGLRKIKRRCFKIIDPNISGKDVLNYITSRNMRKTLTPLMEGNVSNQNDKLNFINVEKHMNLIAYSWKQSEKPLSSLNSLTLHTDSNLLGNLITKQPEESPAEVEDSWGGPEAFKLITFLKHDFNEVVSKIPDVIVMFYAFWCPHCLRLKKPYGNAALLAKEAKLEVVFAAFDVTINQDIADDKGIVGIPIIKYYKFGKYVSTYTGRRTTVDIFEFVKNPPKPPMSDFKTPDV